MFNRFASLFHRFQPTLTKKSLRVMVVALALVATAQVLAAQSKATGPIADRESENSSAQDQVLAGRKAKTTGQLLALAQSAIDAQNEILVTGNAEKAISRHASASGVKDLVEKRSADLLDRRAALAENQVAYTGNLTTLIPTKVVIGESNATLWATEHTVLSLKPVPGGPPTTEYDQDHRFQFEKPYGEWVLVSDQLIDAAPPEAPVPGELPVYTTPTRRAPGKPGEDQDKESAGVSALAYSSLNRPAIAEYATRYYRYYNTRYHADANDCTNFASQALYAGGWTMVSGFYTYNSVWWYNFSAFFSPYHSYTWGGAHNFYWFTATRPRGTIATYFSQLKVGDILQADWEADGYMNHTMVVTKKSSTGELYLTYHTSNTLNKPLSDLLKTYPKARWYGWRLYDYPN